MKIYNKIILTVTFLVAVVFLGIFINLDRHLTDYVDRQIRTDLQRKTALARTLLEKAYSPGMDAGDIDALADIIGEDVNLRATIIAPNGVVVGDSERDLRSLGDLDNHSERSEIRQALSDGAGQSVRYSTTLRRDMLYAASRFGEPATLGVIRLAMPWTDVVQIVSSVRRALGAALLLAFVVAFLVMYPAARVLTLPLQRINETAKAMASGDFSRRIDMEGRDEVGELARSINLISDQVTYRMKQVKKGRSRLEAVFSSMSDGVMVVDRTGLVSLTNLALREMIPSAAGSSGRKPIEVIRHLDVQDMVDRLLSGERDSDEREVAFFAPEERTVQVHGTPVRRGDKLDGAVLVFRDITELRRLENVRREFVANVSHELRTPVSCIKGYTETLLDGALDDKDHAREFLRIVQNDAERLAQLIEDLLTLSRIESGREELSFQACNLHDTVEEISRALHLQAQDNNVTIHTSVDPGLPPIRADQRALSQIVRNLLDNAIKYNRPGGAVTVTAETHQNRLHLQVTDTGIGIPADDQSRIFERFYRVDKAHSRQIGGTGLGLSIVKHLSQALGGEVWLEHSSSQGTSFVVALPLA